MDLAIKKIEILWIFLVVRSIPLYRRKKRKWGKKEEEKTPFL